MGFTGNRGFFRKNSFFWANFGLKMAFFDFQIPELAQKLVFLGGLQTRNFNVFAYKLGIKGGIYVFLKLPVLVKVTRNLVVFQSKNPEKTQLFF